MEVKNLNEHKEDINRKILNPLGNANIGKLILKFGIPSIIALLVSSLYNIVDQIFIGRGVGILGNAATNVAFPLTTICVATALLFGIGGASNFNLELGAGNETKASKFAGNSVTLLLLAGITITVVVRVFLKPMMLAFGATLEVLPYAMTYTSITSLGFPFLIATNGICNLIRADGRPQYSMVCMLMGAIINIILDPLFIFGFGWGMAGAALATILGQIISFMMAAGYLLRFRSVSLTKESFKPELYYVKKIVLLGVAGCVNQLAMTVVQIAMNNTLTYYGAKSVYGSEIPLACVGIITKVGMIFMSFAIGTSQGCQPIIGFNYGAKQYERVKKTYKLAIMGISVICVIAFLCFQLFPRQIIGIFGGGTEMYFQFAERYFRIYMLLTVFNGIQPLTSNFFTSIGKAFKGVFMSLTRQVLFLLPLIIIFPKFMGIDGVMYAGPIADGMAAVLAGSLAYHELKNMGKQKEVEKIKGEYTSGNAI